MQTWPSLHPRPLTDEIHSHRDCGSSPRKLLEQAGAQCFDSRLSVSFFPRLLLRISNLNAVRRALMSVLDYYFSQQKERISVWRKGGVNCTLRSRMKRNMSLNFSCGAIQVCEHSTRVHSSNRHQCLHLRAPLHPQTPKTWAEHCFKMEKWSCCNLRLLARKERVLRVAPQCQG